MTKKFSGGYLPAVLQLGKIKISVPVALTGFLGYFRGDGSFSEQLAFTISGIFFMAMGSSAINQIQERDIDRQMERTAARPIPSGRLPLSQAIAYAVAFSAGGLALLFMTESLIAALLGAFTLAWYNLVYTPLKKITPFAVLPGAIIGALPPLIGWTAAGQSLFEKEILFISFFLFIGQMPHYWLLLIKVGDEFKNAGLPVITELLSKDQLRKISFIWMIAASVSVVIFPAAGIMHSYIIAFIMIAGVLIFGLIILRITIKGDMLKNWRKLFITENLFYLYIITILIADKYIVL
ncbi:MAG TPA: protoheme IX farnesyltransferase [Bacteroidales bacterium]|nr:protoheme IX farnesyltransferase [Bacteroidales bacterium]